MVSGSSSALGASTDQRGRKGVYQEQCRLVSPRPRVRLVISAQGKKYTRSNGLWVLLGIRCFYLSATKERDIPVGLASDMMYQG